MCDAKSSSIQKVNSILFPIDVQIQVLKGSCILHSYRQADMAMISCLSICIDKVNPIYIEIVVEYRSLNYTVGEREDTAKMYTAFDIGDWVRQEKRQYIDIECLWVCVRVCM